MVGKTGSRSRSCLGILVWEPSGEGAESKLRFLFADEFSAVVLVVVVVVVSDSSLVAAEGLEFCDGAGWTGCEEGAGGAGWLEAGAEVAVTVVEVFGTAEDWVLSETSGSGGWGLASGVSKCGGEATGDR